MIFCAKGALSGQNHAQMIVFLENYIGAYVVANVFSFAQKLVMVTILGWLGLQFTPTETEDAKKDAASARSAVVSLLN